MQKHKDGSVTLSEQELAELTKVYDEMRDIILNSPATAYDYKDTDQYMDIEKWHCILIGIPFD